MKKKSGIPFTHIRQIKQGVWLLISNNENWVLKEYLSTFKLSVQIDFAKELKNNGFMQTYLFFPHIFQLEGRIFGLMQYIESKNNGAFHYDQDKNIQSALELITNFHQTTATFVDTFKEKLPYFQQRSKWEKRLIDYYTYINIHRFNPVYSHLNRLAQYGVWALEHMNEHVSYFVKKPHCIIHGDVASHNFIKSNGILYMIDFDLISIAPSHIDLLQFCNRILPLLDWDAERLFSFELLNNLKNERPFLAALVYPTDIFREWIFYSTSNNKEQSKKWSYVQRLTFHKYKERLVFYEKIKDRVEKWK
ncbi:phosphotransferase [Bacillus sp. FJAT-49711]|uniref:phosphotransferase n=1 Tax=Bacillus sp. FJAT-49711 TaxID=2833585 RepID=UPI001BC9F622|nr:phosphotransferase [Bacillus sp. FJAT-49711]MBS4217023.1 phosphotransferase [Bacillus sp. FJAT-49711]